MPVVAYYIIGGVLLLLAGYEVLKPSASASASGGAYPADAGALAQRVGQNVRSKGSAYDHALVAAFQRAAFISPATGLYDITTHDALVQHGVSDAPPPRAQQGGSYLPSGPASGADGTTPGGIDPVTGQIITTGIQTGGTVVTDIINTLPGLFSSHGDSGSGGDGGGGLVVSDPSSPTGYINSDTGAYVDANGNPVSGS